MQLEKIQHIIARLYTEEKFREVFFADVNKFCVENSFTDAESRNFLFSLSEKQFIFFASGLLNKRMHEVQNLLPLTAKTLGCRFKELFLNFAKNKSAKGIHLHHNDSLNFCIYLVAERKNDLKSEWTAVINFEKLRIENYLNKRKTFISFHNFNPREMYLQLESGNGFSTENRLRTLLIWQRGKIKWSFSFGRRKLRNVTSESNGKVSVNHSSKLVENSIV